MFQHFGNRLKRDLKHLVDRRLDASATASGSLQKVSTFLFFWISNFQIFFSLSLPASRLMLFRTNANGSYFSIYNLFLKSKSN
jgi:hypothetical protein